jgi:DNA-binding NarL/FixJ family response regulator
MNCVVVAIHLCCEPPKADIIFIFVLLMPANAQIQFTMNKITILITDDHTLVRQTWRFILNSDARFSVVAECASGEEAIETATKVRPDIVIMDINLPGMNGFETTQLIRKNLPATRVLGVSMHSQPSYAQKMIAVGAMGYITKSSSCDELSRAIIEIYNGQRYLCEEIRNIVSERNLAQQAKHPEISSLTSRERDIATHIKARKSTKEIAAQLNISIKNVEVHRYNILEKLKLKNTDALLNYLDGRSFVN